MVNKGLSNSTKEAYDEIFEDVNKLKNRRDRLVEGNGSNNGGQPSDPPQQPQNNGGNDGSSDNNNAVIPADNVESVVSGISQDQLLLGAAGLSLALGSYWIWQRQQSNS